MKLYIENWKLIKDKDLSEELEKEFAYLCSFYKERCMYDNSIDVVAFDSFDNLEEKKKYIKRYKNFIKRIKLEYPEEKIEDDILPSIKEEGIYNYDYGKTYITDDKDIFFVEADEDIPSKYLDKNPKIIHPICLSKDDVEYVLKNLKLPKGTICSNKLYYWTDSPITLSVEECFFLVKSLSSKNKKAIRYILIEDSIIENLRHDFENDRDYINNFDYAFSYDILRIKFDDFENEYSKLKLEYDTYHKEHRYIGSLRKRVFNSLNEKRRRKIELSEREKEVYKEICFSLAVDNDKYAIYEMAYGYYGGDDIFPCDYFKSSKYLEKLGELGDNFAYNSLGYIYYYGRLNNGVPEYEKAYRCFSFGEQAGIEESTYKLGDMYKNGYYVKKDLKIAFSLYSRYYFRELRNFLNNNFSNKLPDITLRLAFCYFDGICVKKDLNDAFFYIRLAKISSSYRIKEWDFFGNFEVDKSINSLYEKIYSEYKKLRKNKRKESKLEYLLELDDYLLTTIDIKDNLAKIKIRSKSYNNILLNEGKELKFVEDVNIQLKLTEQFDDNTAIDMITTNIDLTNKYLVLNDKKYKYSKIKIY